MLRTIGTRRAPWAAGLLLAVLAALAVLVHHGLAGATTGPAPHGTAPMTPAARAAHGVTAIPHGSEVMTMSGDCAGGLCVAAGVAAPPLPAALPGGTTIVPPPLGADVSGVGVGPGPPPPLHAASVLRI